MLLRRGGDRIRCHWFCFGAWAMTPLDEHGLVRKRAPQRMPTIKSYGGGSRIRTGGKGFAGLCLTTWPLRLICKGPIEIGPGAYNGADNGARTRDPNLGKVVLYQLSHVRLRESTIRNQTIMCKSFFMIVYAAGVILGVVQTATACPHGHAATSPHRCRGDEFLPQGSLACVSRRHPPRDRCAVICVKPEIRLLFQTILKKMEKVVDRTLVSGLY